MCGGACFTAEKLINFMRERYHMQEMYPDLEEKINVISY